MTRPLISCVVPAYNSERYLRDALASILAQTYRPIEIVVADDGSTDSTAQVARSYSVEVLHVSQPTGGPAATRNLGLRAARGPFVAFLDADDLWAADKLERQMGRFDERPELDLCLTHAQMFWTEELRDEAGAYRELPRARPVPGYATTTLLARRAAFDLVGEFNPDLWFADATDWFIRAQERGLVLEILPDVLVHHRMHAENLTRRQDLASRREFLRVVKASIDRRRTGKPVARE